MLRILALLENDSNSLQVVNCLENSGNQVTVCRNYKAAIEKLSKPSNVDLVISDVHLENGGNVFDFLRWVRKEGSALASTPFVLYSYQPSPIAKHLEDGLRTTAKLLGAAHFISCDVFDDEFVNEIEGLMLQADRFGTPSMEIEYRHKNHSQTDETDREKETTNQENGI